MPSELTRCFITDNIIQKIDNTDFDGIFYRVEYSGKQFKFKFYWDHENSSFVEDNKYVLQGLIANGKFPFDETKILYDNDRLEKIIHEAYFPRKPKEKLNNLIDFLFSIQDSEGKEFNLQVSGSADEFINKLYFKNYEEFLLYLLTLQDMNYIVVKRSLIDSLSAIDTIRFTFSGLEYVIELQESGEKSRNCFIAMSFSDLQQELRNTLKEAITDCDYTPVLVDEINFDSDVTINDAIISNIKQSKFMIADFTEQKHGVYFEAGYALGQGKPVIYTCNRTDFSNTHFDTNHYPHIVYENLKELKEKLVYKIKAWID